MTTPDSSPLLAEYCELLKEAGAVVGGPVAPITSSDVVVVVDMQHDFLPGGAFGVAEGDQTVKPIVQLIRDAAAAGAAIYATRDYHPADHCSFAGHGGPFPSHCVQNTRGSQFAAEIGAALAPLVANGTAQVVFKGFSKDTDSFGGFEYSAEDAASRLSINAGAPYCGPAWTGAFVLFSSTMAADVNAPPDVMAVLNRVPLADAVKGKLRGSGGRGRVLVCGLALDFCVLDTAVNAARQLASPELGERPSIVILADASRAAHIPGVGQHGTGFLSDPSQMAKRLQEAHVALARSPTPT